ncbi:MAG: DUF438 domain-containing protein, partial [Halobacteria archaeon]
LESTTPLEIARIEEELIKEGIPREEILRLCDVHLAVFREQLERQKIEVPLGHAIGILIEEHRILLERQEKLNSIAAEPAPNLVQLKQIAIDYLEAEKHYLREENVLFPVLEKHGITEPPAIMWMEHNQLRERKKAFRNLIENYNTMSLEVFKKQLGESAEALNSLLSSHIFKENNILFPAAMRVVTEQEWRDIRREFDEIGYPSFTPRHLLTPISLEAEKPVAAPPELWQFETGSLSKEEVEGILNTLPVDITFVDREDAVKYFSKAEKRIFVRTKAILGRKVQLCHPQKSIHIVNKILDAFKAGKKDFAEFWIKKGESLIYIRYFAVRDKAGKYLGTLEVTQDISDIKKIEGEKRLLDWGE